MLGLKPSTSRFEVQVVDNDNDNKLLSKTNRSYIIRHDGRRKIFPDNIAEKIIEYLKNETSDFKSPQLKTITMVLYAPGKVNSDEFLRNLMMEMYFHLEKLEKDGIVENTLRLPTKDLWEKK